jgi:hypothetical protein
LVATLTIHALILDVPANVPPYFVAPLEPLVFRYAPSEIGTVARTFTFPETADQENKTVAISVEGLHRRFSFMTYDDLSRTLTVKPWRDSQFGSFTLHVNLTDADGVSRYYRMDIEVIKGQELPQEEPEEAVKSNSSTEVIEEPYTKYVEFSCSKSNQYSNYTYG